MASSARGILNSRLINRINGGAITVASSAHITALSWTHMRMMSMQTDNSVTPAQSSTSLPSVKKRNTTIIRLHPADYEGSAVGQRKPTLPTRRGEPISMAESLQWRDKDKPGEFTDELVSMQAEIDLRPSAIKRMLSAVKAELEIKDQTYKSERVAVLGRDLGAAHFIVARKGRIRFMGHTDWISSYQRSIDNDKEDLPANPYSNCTLPVRYDPNYRVERLDASGVNIRYEGLANFGGLNYVKWMSFRGNQLFDDWCLDRVFCNHGETLDYLDISGCPKITLNGLSAVARIKNLNTLVVEDLPQVKDLEIICAILEDNNPSLTCVGIDYERKLAEIRAELKEWEDRTKREAEQLEARTVEVVPREIAEQITEAEEAKVRKGN